MLIAKCRAKRIIKKTTWRSLFNMVLVKWLPMSLGVVITGATTGVILKRVNSDPAILPVYTVTYTPPALPGHIYMVVRKSEPSVVLSYSWGTAQNKGTMDVSRHQGVVLRLQHFKRDAIPISIRSNGKIIQIRQYQKGSHPTEWNSIKFLKIEW